MANHRLKTFKPLLLWAFGFAVLFYAFSMVQRIILGMALWDPRFVFPALVGAVSGFVLGALFHKNRDKNRFLESILDSIRAPLLVIDAKDYSIAMANRAARQSLRPRASHCYELSHCRSTPCEGPSHTCPLTEIKRTREPVTVEHLHFSGPDGTQTVTELHAYPVFDAEGKLTHIIEYGVDITERLRAEHALRENEAHLDYLAHHDQLTGLPNRTLFLVRLQQAIARAERFGHCVALLFLDLDQIKSVNDTLGHPVGDSLLKATATRLSAAAVAGETLARFGGDEFTIIVEGMNNIDEATQVARTTARKLLDALLPPFELAGREFSKTGSIGIALYPQDGGNADDLIKNADTAMYHAKSRGGNVCQFYSEQMNVATMERLVLESALRKSIEQRELKVHYQPQIDLANGEVVGLEALLRWQHRDFGAVSPERFIPIAEQTGLIEQIGEWVLQEACSLPARLRGAGLRPVRVSVNLSPRQFRRPHLADDVARILAEATLAPGLLELEITENVMMHNPDDAVATMLALKRHGVRISCDDFGTGYSSLSYIHRLPLDALKIDR